MNPEVFIGGCVVPHPFKPWEGHAVCADCHGARHARLGDNRALHPLPSLDGTTRSAVRPLTGHSDDQLDELGGFDEEEGL